MQSVLRPMKCVHGHDLTKHGALYATGRKRCKQCHREQRMRSYYNRKEPIHMDEEIREWAQAVWNAWTPHERAEFAGAMQLILERIQGAGDGTAARRRSTWTNP